MVKQKTVEATQNVREQEEEEQQVEELANAIEKLQEHGINVADIQKLKNSGICTVKGLLMTTIKDLNKIKGLSEAKIEKMLESASKLEGWTWMSGLQVEVQRQKVKKISTGSTRMDEMLGGGVESKSITEV
eukprot:CAMPEP_0116937982 /NCGR_PEP_ID=MMETSP0467-20121206/31835_1 /TAXON_ID=283647 /ORGANISM="Mesodinium pulex, Strain SPMC105" /LENGTH=130 /DNA_ID=CAMNT_0004619915 /DNA_START=8 /DNA_END=400 /DNA_ORIENTATION=-